MFREPAPGTRLGRWRILRKLGQGGMGAVYAADDAEGRQAALKLMLVADPAFLARFEREARAAAAVRHEGIAQTFEFFSEQGIPVLAMELLPGGSLRDLVKARGALPWPDAAAYAQGVARGLAAIHARGLVHRDLKPANVLLDAQGRPKITDFGLVGTQAGLTQAGAKALTKTGEMLGTYAYMAPEQAEDSGVDYRADLYSLGATLYELLSGRPPFEGEGFALIRKHLTEKPRSLRDRGIPDRLDKLVLRLLAKEPQERPETAADVARDLEEIVRAKDAPEPSRSRRGPAVWVGLGLVVVAAGAGLAVVAMRSPATATPPVPAPGPGVPTTPPAPPTPPPPPPGPKWPPLEQRFQDLCAKALVPTRLTKLVSARGHVAMRHAGCARMVAFTLRDGKPLILSVGYSDGVVRGWDPETGASVLPPIFLPAGIRSMAVDAAGKRAVFGTIGGGAYAYDLASGRRIAERTDQGGEVSVAISTDGKVAASGGQSRQIVRWAIDGGAPDRILPLEVAAWWLRFDPDEARTLVIGLDSGLVLALDRDADGPANLSSHGRPTTEGVFDRERRVLSVGDDGRLLRQRLPRQARPGAPIDEVNIHAPERPERRIYALDVSRDGRTVATGADDGRVELHDGRTLGPGESFSLGKAGINSLAFSPDGKQLAAACSDGAIRLVDLTGRELFPAINLDTHDAAVTALAVSPDGRTVVSGSVDATMRVWDVSEKTVTLRRMEERPSALTGAAFVREGAGEPRLLTLEAKGPLQLRSTDDGAPARAGNVDGYPAAFGIDVAPDGRFVFASRDWGSPAQLLRTSDLGEEVALPTAAYRADFSKDGKWAVVAGAGKEGNNLFRVSLETKKVTTFDGDKRGHLLGVAFVDDEGRRAVLGSASQLVALWDFAKGKSVFASHVEAPVEAVLRLGAWIGVRAGAKLVLLDEDLQRRDVIDLRAIQDTVTALAVDPERHALWIGTGKGALLRFSVAAKDEKGDRVLGLVQQANEAFGRGDYARSIARGSEAIALDPTLAVAHATRGTAQREKGDLEAAAADYAKAIEVDPAFTYAYAGRGRLRAKKTDFEGAKADFARAIELYPNFAPAWDERAALRERSGDLAGAVADYNRFLALIPEGKRSDAIRKALPDLEARAREGAGK